MRLFLIASVPLLLLSVQSPALAQDNAAPAKSTKKCQPEKKKKRSMFGAIAGGIAGTALGHTGVPGGLGMLSLPLGSLISEGIAALLDCKEQVQAAKATEDAVRGGVGTTSTWESESRPGVKGSSTVRDQRASADGGSCMLITDVVIVDGEETTVDKRMCRKPGGGNYVLAA
jgi:surface antigen